MNNNFQVTTVIAIRHAERKPPTASNTNPALNDAGLKRAEELIHVLGQSDISVIYNSHFLRSKQTGQPLADRLGISAIQLDEALEIRNDILSNHRGMTILVIGHSDTIPELIGLLGGEGMPVLSATEFDNLFVVTILNAEMVSVKKFKYGAPS